MSLLVQEDRDGTLPPEDVGFLASVLLTEQKPSPQAFRKKSFWPVVVHGKMRSMAERSKTSAKVKAALNQHLPLDGFRYTHVNFLATEKSASPSSPVLFFAEFDNEKAEGESPVLCCKVDMPLPCADNLESMSVKNIGNVEYNTTKHLMTFKFTPGKVVFTSQWHANV
uniref:DUF3615 domain-containing protein n=1 Tax=Oryza meridionalis TaxID=40149 RepID=A0A0E0EVD9_9ORYZ